MRKTVSATEAVQAPVALAKARAVIDHGQPPDVVPVGANAPRASADHCSPLRGIDGIGDHQPRIVHDAIGIFERGAEWPLQRVADGMVGDVDGR
jgi:hypothetical protein